jgi:hypothetical protein
MHIRAFFLFMLLVAAIGSAPVMAATPMRTLTIAAAVAMFETEAAAQKHCPRDIVVWLNTSSGTYHEKGMRWYGRTKHGAFVCKKEADAAGDRDTRNGQ